MAESTHDLIVIGSGIAGLSAATRALQDGFSTAMLEAAMFGGLITNVNELDGAVLGSGVDLASNCMMEVSDLGVVNISAAAADIVRDGDTLVVVSDAGRHRAHAVIVASGARLKRLGIPGEAEFEHKGVSDCADCDGPLFQGQDVVVVGGGDSALQLALVLAAFCKQVHLLLRGNTFRAQRHFVDRIDACGNVVVHRQTRLQAVLGREAVESVTIADAQDKAPRDLPCNGVFVYVGLDPASRFLPASVARDAAGFVTTDARLQTSMTGVFAAGAIRSGHGGLLSHAISEGTLAAESGARDDEALNVVAPIAHPNRRRFGA